MSRANRAFEALVWLVNATEEELDRASRMAIDRVGVRPPSSSREG